MISFFVLKYEQLKVISVVVLLMGNRTDPALAAKATPKSNRFTTVSSKPEAENLHTLHSSVGNL